KNRSPDSELILLQAIEFVALTWSSHINKRFSGGVGGGFINLKSYLLWLLRTRPYSLLRMV
ncbi:MAG: hypothetical protein HC786_33515, partial [Richelia sp. CSU_2_1]|nr:hypothetical protein [Richelia sp. CSU_2_1]